MFSEERAKDAASKGQIRLRITFPGRAPIFATQLDGGVIKVRVDGRTWGMITATVGSSTEEALVTLFEYDRDDIKIHKGSLLQERLSVRTQFDTFSKSAPFQIRVETIKLGDSGAITNDSGEPIIDENRCCVSCGGVTVCACAVSAACGNCCAGICC
jgi:hypothetical protein